MHAESASLIAPLENENINTRPREFSANADVKKKVLDPFAGIAFITPDDASKMVLIESLFYPLSNHHNNSNLNKKLNCAAPIECAHPSPKVHFPDFPLCGRKKSRDLNSLVLGKLISAAVGMLTDW